MCGGLYCAVTALWPGCYLGERYGLAGVLLCHFMHRLFVCMPCLSPLLLCSAKLRMFLCVCVRACVYVYVRVCMCVWVCMCVCRCIFTAEWWLWIIFWQRGKTSFKKMIARLKCFRRHLSKHLTAPDTSSAIANEKDGDQSLRPSAVCGLGRCMG